MTLYWPTISEQIVTPTGTYLYDRGPNHVPRYHQGCDIRVPVGTPIYASGEGVVTGVFNTGNHSGFGRYVQVQYGTLQVRTAHMSSANVIVGQRVFHNHAARPLRR
jgi:murein DD-endopeptidase MepM/ murein hydrolase activator NlpD